MVKRILLFFCFLLFAILSEAAVWENIPIFPQSQKVKEEESTVNANKVQTAIYTTAAASEEVTGFYKTKLVNFGWKLETETNQQSIEVLMFSKGDKFLNIMLQNILGRNFITLAQSMKPKELARQKSPCPECEKLEEEVKKKLETSKELDIKEIKIPGGSLSKVDILPKEDAPGRDLQFVPRYPQAVRLSSVERDNGRKVSLAYCTKDSVDNAVNFYLQNMGNYYWELKNEIDFRDLPEQVSEKINVELKGKSLVFKSPSASCIISITEDPQSKSTIIGVNYNEK